MGLRLTAPWSPCRQSLLSKSPSRSLSASSLLTAILALVAFVQLILFGRSEGRRAQPVAVAYMKEPRNAEDRFQAVIENLGTGAAFNVRLGVKLDGIEYPLGGVRGNRYTVGARSREPPQGGFWLQVLPWPYALSLDGPNVDERAVFYARYEDAIGRSWESLNPVDPLADFVIGGRVFVNCASGIKHGFARG